jgi:fructokinase
VTPVSGRLDVVCFGEALWDLFERPAARGSGVDFVRELGGAAANAATGLARLGVRSALVGGVGDDRLGRAMLAHLERDGVDTRFVQCFTRRTGVTFVAKGADGAPAFLPYREGTADGSLRPRHITPAMGRAHWVLVASAESAAGPLATATARFVQAAIRGGASVFLDLNVRAHRTSPGPRALGRIARLASTATVVKASENDLVALGQRRRGYGWLERHAPRATWLVTRGPAPASAVGAHGEVELPARQGSCIDPTGAGDAFAAGALAVLVASLASPAASSWADRRLWSCVLRVGHMMGMKAVSRRGAVAGLVRLDSIRAALAQPRALDSMSLPPRAPRPDERK